MFHEDAVDDERTITEVRFSKRSSVRGWGAWILYTQPFLFPSTAHLNQKFILK